jgi:hypothetical protein
MALVASRATEGALDHLLWRYPFPCLNSHPSCEDVASMELN